MKYRSLSGKGHWPKRMLSFLLACVMVVGLIPVQQALATQTGPITAQSADTTSSGELQPVIYVQNTNHEGVGVATIVLKKLTPNGQDKQFQTDADGVLKLQWKDPSDSTTYIEPGEYTVTMKQQPAGHEFPEGAEVVKQIRFYIDDESDGGPYYLMTGPVTFTVFPQHSIRITKQGADGSPLAGATFSISYNTAFQTNITTGEDGVAIYADEDGGLREGTYTVVETIPPTGFMLGEESSRTKNVYLDSSNIDVKTHELIFSNEPFPVITVTKTEAGTENKLAGALFEVKIDGENVGRHQTGEDGTFSIDFDTYGEFVDDTKDSWTVAVREVTAPDGFMIDNTDWVIHELKAGQTLLPFVFSDTKYPEIVIKKTEKGTNTPLAGAIFELVIDTQKVDEFVTGDDGEIHITYEQYGKFLTKDRQSWTISVRETTPPKGYFIDAPEPQVAELKQGQKLLPFVFTDTAYPDIVVIKKDTETGARLKDATFRIVIEGTAFAEQMITN